MKKSPEIFQSIVIIGIVAWLLLFVFLPNLMIIVTSFLTRDDINIVQVVFTLSNYKHLLNPLYVQVLLHSLNIALIATLCCLAIGYPFAFILTRQPKKLQSFLLFLLVLPFWTNSLIRIYGLKIFLSTRGFLNNILLGIGMIDQPLHIMYTSGAVILGLVYILLPFMVLPLYSSIKKLDTTYLEAACDLGANKIQIFTRIIVPLTIPGIMAGCMLVLLPAIGAFYIADLLGGSKNLLIGNVIKSQFLNMRDWPFGAATSTCLTVAIGLLLLVYYRVTQCLLSKQVEI